MGERYITIGQLVEDNERLREALRFYAQERGLGARLASDGGKIAREALGLITPPNDPPPSD
jgi:DNA-binding response OmpR family regulator